MTTFGGTSAASSTAQQDRIASGNSQQARRASGDNRTFANMLSAAAETAASPELADKARKNDDEGRDDNGTLSADLPSNTPTTAANVPAAQAEKVNTETSGESSEQDNRTTRSPSRASRSAISTLALATRGGAGNAAARPDASESGDTSRAGQLPGSSSAALPVDNPMGKPRNDSVSTALAAAIEDAMDVSDDVTLSASAPLEHAGLAGGADMAAAEVGGLSHSHRRDTDTIGGTDATQTPAEAWQNAWTEAMDRVGQQVSYWLGKGVSQAQLTVHSRQGEPVDVRVMLRDGQVHLEFASNSEATRAAIANNAADALRAVLSQSGIELASLSVDTRASDGQQQNGQSQRGEPGLAEMSAGVSSVASNPAGGLAVESAPLVQRTSRAVLDAYA